MWEEFHHDSLDETTTVTTDYIDFCVQSVIPTKEIKIYPNNKTFITKDVKHIINLRKIAFKNKDIGKLKQIEKDLKSKLREAKRKHRLKLEEAHRSKSSKQLWDTMKAMTGLSTTQKPLVTDNELEFANQLNGFFGRFEKGNDTDLAAEITKTVALSESDRSDVSVEQVRNIFKSLNQRKATGPDNLSAYILKTFADELAPVWQPIYKCSLNTGSIPLMWRTSHIIPVPKVKCPKQPSDYRPVTLTPVVMKALEKIVVQELSESMADKLDSQQFAYKHNRSTEDAVVTLMHLILKHLDKLNYS